jgi:hypothetical protein
MRVSAVCVAAAAMIEIGCVARPGPVVAPLGGSEASWRYDVVSDEHARALRIEAWLPRGSLADLVVRHGAEPFVDDVQVQHADGWHDVPRRGDALHAPECARGCHVRYRFALRDAAQALRNTDMAIAWGDVIEASPSVWLLHPALAPAGVRYRFRVHSPQGVSFATGIFSAEDGNPDTYEADASNIAVAPYAAFGPLRLRRVEAVTGATLDVAIAPGNYQATDDSLVEWVAKGARTMARFLGCFPLERVMVLLVPAKGDQVRHGETMGDGGASMVIEVGEKADAAALAEDWVLPHEMAHLAVPSLSRRHHWLEEGIAVYVQPIARARAGELAPQQVWQEFADGMPRGVPPTSDLGLDDTPDWARTYWGGATFCLVADLEIRKRTGNRLGLEDALRGVLASGGSIARIWRFDRLLDTADAFTGTSVLRSIDDEMGRVPWTIDLSRLFRELGVVRTGDRVTLVEDAPLAAVRRSITEPLPFDVPAPTVCRYGAPGRLAKTDPARSP